MYYIPCEKCPVENVQFVYETEKKTPFSWVNVNQAHTLYVVKIDEKYCLKLVFSKDEYYYIASFESEKHAKSYASQLLRQADEESY
jgi:hypothetical protein